MTHMKLRYKFKPLLKNNLTEATTMYNPGQIPQGFNTYSNPSTSYPHSVHIYKE